MQLDGSSSNKLLPRKPLIRPPLLSDTQFSRFPGGYLPPSRPSNGRTSPDPFRFTDHRTPVTGQARSTYNVPALSGEHLMRYRRFGRTGWNVSEIGYGMWGMAGWTGSDDPESLAALQRAVDLGCNFFDTAWAYGDGHSEQLLGKILRANKNNPAAGGPDKKLYVATKIPPKNLRWPARPASVSTAGNPPTAFAPCAPASWTPAMSSTIFSTRILKTNFSPPAAKKTPPS